MICYISCFCLFFLQGPHPPGEYTHMCTSFFFFYGKRIVPRHAPKVPFRLQQAVAAPADMFATVAEPCLQTQQQQVLVKLLTAKKAQYIAMHRKSIKVDVLYRK